MYPVTCTDLVPGDMVSIPGRWEGVRIVARVEGDNILTGDPFEGWRWDVSSEWYRERPYSEHEARWFRPFD